MGYNNYRNGYKNHNRNNDRDRKVYSDDDRDKKVDLSKLDINSILDSDTENLVFDNYDDDRFSKKPYKNKDNKNNFNKEWDNPLCKFLDKDSVYDRDDIYNVLTKKNGLSKMIDDLKEWDSNKNQRKPYYISQLLRNIVFASALPEAIDKLLKKNDLGMSEINKKDLDVLMNEILILLNDTESLHNKYDDDSVESMIKAYTNILYKFNKKKVKKFKDIKGLSEATAKKLIVLTAGKRVQTSIYQLLKFLYVEVDDNEFLLNKKILLKIFKICYGKSQMRDVIKYIMLEKNYPNMKDRMSAAACDLWVIIDQIMRDELEKMDKKEISSIVKEYISERKRQEKNGRVPRRLGDRRSIHPDDYPRLTKVFENIESKDFSIVSYLR